MFWRRRDETVNLLGRYCINSSTGPMVRVVIIRPRPRGVACTMAPARHRRLGRDTTVLTVKTLVIIISIVATTGDSAPTTPPVRTGLRGGIQAMVMVGAVVLG